MTQQQGDGVRLNQETDSKQIMNKLNDLRKEYRERAGELINVSGVLVSN